MPTLEFIAEINRLRAENERLKSELADYRRDYEHAMRDNACEQHCSCVPALKRRIGELEAELTTERAAHEALKAQLEAGQRVYLARDGDGLLWISDLEPIWNEESQEWKFPVSSHFFDVKLPPMNIRPGECLPARIVLDGE